MAPRSSSPSIAVIGLACRYPDANTPRELWENVLTRRRQFRRMPDCRLPLGDYYDADKETPDKTYVRQAALIDGFDFDWAARRIPLSTVRATDIVHWLALETSLAAVADAGYSQETLPGRQTGVIIGNTLTGEQTRANTMRLRWPFVRRALQVAARTQGLDEGQIRLLTRALKDRYTAAFPPVDEDSLAGGLSNTIAGRICNYLNLMGGGFTVDGACSSSLLAVAHAASRLLDGDLDLAIVGGVDISLDPFELIGFAKTRALSDGDMTVYDRGGKGFIPGEGCGFMVLKPLDAARRDGNRVYAVIHGWGISSDGGGTGITAPNAAGQALAIERAYRNTPFDIGELSFIEGHGTGTAVGDRTELEAIARVLGRTPVPRGQLRPCGITSLKSIIGHTKAASGIGGLIKAVMAVNRRVIPPTAACNEPHQAFDREARRIYPVRLGYIQSADKVMAAGVSSMGFGGINCHITLCSGDAPDDRLSPVLDETVLLAHSQESELFAVGADNETSMLEKITTLIDIAKGASVAELADLSADLSRQVTPDLPLKAAVVAGYPDDLVRRLMQLEAALREGIKPAQTGSVMAVAQDVWIGEGNANCRVGFLFPGQGSQQLNMGRMLVQRFAWAREMVQKADAITTRIYDLPVSHLIFRDLDRAPGPEERDRWRSVLARTDHVQPAICLNSMLWLAFMSRLGIHPEIVGGHSLGELSAFYAAGAFDEATLITFAARRGKAMAAAGGPTGAMVSLRCDETKALEFLSQVDGYITVANLNSPRQTVLSGESMAVETVERLARQNGVGATILPVAGAFHSRLCETAARQVEEMALLKRRMQATVCPIVSSVDGGLLQPGFQLGHYFGRQILSQVDFIRMARNMAARCDILLEIGPGHILSGLVRSVLDEGGLPCQPVEGVAGGASDLNRALAALFVHGVPIHWEMLFENRLIRPFVPAKRKTFVVNPCETLAPDASMDTERDSVAVTEVGPVLAEAFNGVPDALVSRYLASRGAFVNRVVQADLAFWDPESRPGLGEGDARSISAEEPLLVKEILFQLVADVTGFPKESLSMESRFLDDLNLDSIKAGDLIARFARTCGVAFPDPALLANASLGEVAGAARQLSGDQAGVAGSRGVDRTALGDRLKAKIADITGFPLASIDLDMRLLDDLSLDSIKAGDLIARLAADAGISGQLDVSSLANATLSQVVDGIAHGVQPTAAATAPMDALTELLRQASRVTGFSGETLDPDLPVAQGLRINVEKLQILVQAAAATMGIDANLDIEPLRSRSLRQISEILDRMAARKQGDVAAMRDAMDRPTWVRNYVMDLVVAPYPRLPDTWGMRSENDFQKARVLIMHSDDTVNVAEMLGQQFFQRGALVQVVSFDAQDAETLARDPRFSHLAAILPRNGLQQTTRSQFLQRMIRMRASLVSVPPAASAPRRRTTVAWIQFGGGFFGRQPRFAHLDRCAGMALAASLHLERNDLRVRVLDFCSALSPEAIAWETLAEMITSERFAAVGYDLDRTRRIFSPRLVQPATFLKRAIEWSAEDVILVTGGAKGITAKCTLAVARETGVRMALVGRSPYSYPSASDDATNEIRTLLEKYAAHGLVTDYFPCDVNDRGAVAHMLAAVTDRLGPVTGVIHGAGLNRPRLTGQVSPEQAYIETAPKVLGLLNLLDALETRPPKLIVGMGSIIGITGMPGNGWYGFSNEAMDIALREFAAAHYQTRIANVAYSIWRDEGMGARMGSVAILQEKGIDAIPTKDGVDRFVKIFTHDPGHSQIVVTARMSGLDTWHQVLPDEPSGFRFLETRTHLTPGVEAIFSAHLALDTDPYLIDHHFQGSYLFPTVFGLEAMAQAANYLCEGWSVEKRVQLRDIKLLRPITVEPETGADIEIRAVLAEAQGDGEAVVHASIVKKHTGMSADCFSATFVFGGADRFPPEIIGHAEKPLPLNPQTDLYRSSLLFQGPRFQGIEAVWEIRDNGEKSGHATLSARVMTEAERAETAFASQQPTHWCLADPFFTDALLQSAALLVPQDTSLPVSIGRMDLFPDFFSASSPATVRTERMGRKDRDLIFRVTAVGDNGEVRAVLEDYRLRILKHHEDYPRVTDLIFPGHRDRQLIAQVLTDACRRFSITAPLLEVDCLPGVHEHTKPGRHQMERPMMERVLSLASKQFELPVSEPKVHWRESGKPEIAGLDQSVLDVSASHEDRTCICACGPGPVGCDLAAITPRDRKAWNILLGSAKEPLLNRLIDQGEVLDTAGTRIWAAAETLAKATGRTGGELTMVRKEGDAVLFRGGGAGEASFQILTATVHLTWGHPMVLAVTVTGEVVARVPGHLLTADYPGYEPLYETRPFEMIEGGPQGQLVFVQRLPVTFRPSANLSRTIYFANFIKWMGNTREASAWPVLAEMSEQFASGRWGGVTNYGHLKILGEGRTSDQIEILMWVSDNSGPENSTMTLSYDFRKMIPGGGTQRLAFCRMQTTWVEILGPGVARVAPYPAYYGQFIEDMCPRFDAPDTPEPMAESLAHLFEGDDDPVIYLAPPGPVVQPIVRKQTFETGLAHANLVGNIYYANYYEWQGQIRDRFFYELIPDFYHGIGERGELLALESRVDHLREAMPFDRIALTLAVKELRTCSVTFHVDYFRLEPDGSRLKIAYGMHRAVWVKRDSQGNPMAAAFPDKVRAAFDEAIHLT